VYTFQAFFGWPDGSIWGNLVAGVLVAAWVSLKARSQRKLHEEIREMHERHHAEHMNALSLDSPGGLAAVMSAAQDARAAAESAHGAVQGLALVAGAPKPAATGKTTMRRAASGRFLPRDEEGA
jgi:hypothetical protein